LWAVALALVVLAGCKEKQAGTAVGVFVPGVMSGSPIYEMLAQGVQRAVDEWGLGRGKIETAVVEGGYNQAEWEPKLTAMAASKRYALIVSSNPSLPAIVSSISAKFPDQKFLLLDGELAGNPSVYSMRYNQREQGYMAGYIAGLEAQEMAGETGEKRIGLITGQEYPAMNDVILPAYREGAQAVDPAFGVDFRVLGNWFDAGKAAEIAADMIRGGSRVILCVAGGANEGIVQAAVENNAKVVWMDTNGYMVRPGTVVGSSVVYQDKAAYEKVKLFLEGELPFGTAEIKGVADGYVDFVQDDPNYIKFVSEAVRERQAAMVEEIRKSR
jgi:simple sugar transport system substrate-binding protein